MIETGQENLARARHAKDAQGVTAIQVLAAVRMIRLASILYSIASTTLAGSAIIAALVMGYDTLLPILAAAGFGFVAALPASYLVAKKIVR